MCSRETEEDYQLEKDLRPIFYGFAEYFFSKIFSERMKEVDSHFDFRYSGKSSLVCATISLDLMENIEKYRQINNFILVNAFITICKDEITSTDYFENFDEAIESLLDDPEIPEEIKEDYNQLKNGISDDLKPILSEIFGFSKKYLNTITNEDNHNTFISIFKLMINKERDKHSDKLTGEKKDIPLVYTNLHTLLENNKECELCTDIRNSKDLLFQPLPEIFSVAIGVIQNFVKKSYLLKRRDSF